MLIRLSPTVKNEETNPPKISLNGLILTVGSTDIDLSLIPEGGQAEADEDSPLQGICTREQVTVKYPYSTHDYSPMQSTDPADYEIELLDGQTLKCPLRLSQEAKKRIADLTAKYNSMFPKYREMTDAEKDAYVLTADEETYPMVEVDYSADATWVTLEQFLENPFEPVVEEIPNV